MISAMDQLDRIEAKLDRLQSTLDQASPLLELPNLLATAGNTLDDLAARDGNAQFDARMRRALRVLVALSEPEVLGALERLLAPGFVELLADAAAELPKAADAPLEERGVLGLARVLHEDEVQRALSFLVHFIRRLGRVLDER